MEFAFDALWKTSATCLRPSRVFHPPSEELFGSFAFYPDTGFITLSKRVSLPVPISPPPRLTRTGSVGMELCGRAAAGEVGGGDHGRRSALSVLRLLSHRLAAEADSYPGTRST